MLRSPDVTSHACFSCDPGPLQVVDHTRGVVRVPDRFRGPPTSVNGGVATGLYACIGEVALAAPVRRLQTRLHIPPPLHADLPFKIGDVPGHPDRQQITVTTTEGITVLSGWVSALPDPVIPPHTEALLAGLASPTADQLHRFEHYVEPPRDARMDTAAFSGCFVCGPDAPGGLSLRPRPVTDEVRWLPWHPHRDWRDRNGVALLPAIAALDCTGAQGLHEHGLLEEGESLLLGTYDADVRERPTGHDAEDLRIVTTPAGRDGRKVYTDQGLFTPDGRPLILGRATWIVVTPDVAVGV